LLTPGEWAHEVAVIAMVCVLSVFFVPVAHGPYSAVHGPTTALRALRNRAQVALAMWLGALGFSGAKVQAGTSLLSDVHFSEFLTCSVQPELSVVLRC
jgi:hypothetical protein